MLKKLDLYIIKKFLGTYFYAIGLIISIAVVFDFSEKIDNFVNHGAPLKGIIFEYYLNFIPFFANLFSYLFVFIAVIFFTSNMASKSEIIAMLSSGISYNRILRPYMISAAILALLSFLLGSFVIPKANVTRINFENTYIAPYTNRESDIHRQIEPDVYIYLQSYNNRRNVGYKFSLEKFEDGKLKSKLMADNVRWDTIKKTWTLTNYVWRNIDGKKENLRVGSKLDTAVNIKPEMFGRWTNVAEKMDIYQLDDFVRKEKMRGSENTLLYVIEKYKRFADPFATFIMTLIGVAIAGRKVRGGIGIHLILGLLLSFTYIMFMQISKTFSVESNLNPFLSVWIPNVVYLGIALVLVAKAQK